MKESANELIKKLDEFSVDFKKGVIEYLNKMGEDIGVDSHRFLGDVDYGTVQLNYYLQKTADGLKIINGGWLPQNPLKPTRKEYSVIGKYKMEDFINEAELYLLKKFLEDSPKWIET